MRSWTSCLQIILFLTVSLPLHVSAYTFEPNIVTLHTTGDKSSYFFRLENKEMRAAAVEITIYECRKDLAGKTIKGKEAKDDFIIYPAQVVMMPGDEIGVQVRWIGDPTLTTERAYTIVAREVPIPKKAGDDPANTAGIHLKFTVLVNYEGRIYVTPKGAKPKIVVESVTERTQPERVGGGSGASESTVLDVICANKGTTHKKMETMAFVLMPVDGEGTPIRKRAVTLTIKDVPALKIHFLAGDRRLFVIPRSQLSLPPGPVSVSLTE